MKKALGAVICTLLTDVINEGIIKDAYDKANKAFQAYNPSLEDIAQKAKDLYKRVPEAAQRIRDTYSKADATFRARNPSMRDIAEKAKTLYKRGAEKAK